MTEAQSKAEEILKEFGDREWVHPPAGMGKPKVFGYNNSKPIAHVKGIIEELEKTHSYAYDDRTFDAISDMIVEWKEVLKELEG